MDLKTAYSILDISQSASQDEVKKKYRELTKKYHPDVNKEDGIEEKFKQINEAYQCIVSGKSTNKSFPNKYRNPFDAFNNQYRSIDLSNVDCNITISFKESVLGCRKDVKFVRKGKCNNCNGQGYYNLNNGCTTCNGKGQIVSRQGNMIFTQTCPKCYGQTQTESCSECAATGSIDTEVSVNVNIPGGVVDGNILRLGGMGNFGGNLMGMDQFTDAHLHISVIPESGLTISGMDVISTISISLLEAIRGCNKSVNTILGSKDIKINPLSRNKDEVIIPNMGVNRIGNQKVILDVFYPDDTNKLISTLVDI